MKNEPGAAVYDGGLRLEAYRFRRSFPQHFHACYVLGYVEDGQGGMTCRDVDYALRKGDIVLCNPGDSHACAESGANLDYRGLHIPCETMLDLAEELTGQRELPRFSRNVLRDEEAACCFRALHRQVMSGSREFGREEQLLLLVSRLLRLCGRPFGEEGPARGEAVERVCAFMEENCGEHISLDQLARLAGLSKSALLRAFTREKGVTPYRCLENIRVGAAKKLLEQGVPPAEAALRTGFSDQSHFTNYFSRFIGLAPGAYRELFRDRSGREHLGIIEFPIPVLKSTPEAIRQLRETLYEPEYQDLTVVDFSDLAQGCRTYGEFTEKMREVPEDRLQYLGLAICGGKKAVNRLTGSLPLLR